MSQITHILPRTDWQKVTISENNEPIVSILETPRLILGKNLGPYTITTYTARKTVVEMLEHASSLLPSEYKLAVIEGVRTLTKQKEHWDNKKEEFKKLHPEWSVEELEHQTGLVVAHPTPLANHNCGGAIDVALVYLDGTPVDMGTPPQAMLERNKVEMFSSLISIEQEHNRKVLRDVMVKVGFVWYPGEWWHYCYGDRMWAVYSEKTECFYGPLTP